MQQQDPIAVSLIEVDGPKAGFPVAAEIVEIGPEEQALLAEHQARAKSHGDLPEEQWLPDWFLRKLAEIKAAKEAADAAYKVVKEQLESGRKALVHRWGQQFKECVDARLVREPRKSITLTFGKAGYRKRGASIAVVAPDEARDWALKHGHPGVDATLADVSTKQLKEIGPFVAPAALRLARKTDVCNAVLVLAEKKAPDPPTTPAGFEYRSGGDDFFPDIGIARIAPVAPVPALTQGDQSSGTQNKAGGEAKAGGGGGAAPSEGTEGGKGAGGEPCDVQW